MSTALLLSMEDSYVLLDILQLMLHLVEQVKKVGLGV